MRRLVLSLVFGLAGIMAVGQGGPAARAGVTGKTVNAVFAKVDPKFAAAAKLKAFKKVSFAEGQAVKRSELVRVMHELFLHYQPSFRTTPRPYRVITSYMDRNTDTTLKGRLQELVRWGMVPPASPLVTGGETLTAEEFGDNLSYQYLQLRRLTYQPDPKWSGAISGFDE